MIFETKKTRMKHCEVCGMELDSDDTVCIACGSLASEEE